MACESIDTSTPMGKMIFTVIGAVAELERSLIRERLMMGLERARRHGKKLGRPQALVDREQVATLRAKGLSLRQIALELHVSKDKVARDQTTNSRLVVHHATDVASK